MQIHNSDNHRISTIICSLGESHLKIICTGHQNQSSLWDKDCPPSPGQCPQCTAAAPPRVNIWASEQSTLATEQNTNLLVWRRPGEVLSSHAVRQSACTKTRAHTDTQNSAPSGHASQHRDVLRWLGFQYLFMDTIRGGTLKQNIWCLTENRDHITQDTGKLRADLVCSECVCCARVCNTLQHFIRPRPAAGQSAQSAQSGECSG